MENEDKKKIVADGNEENWGGEGKEEEREGKGGHTRTLITVNQNAKS